MAAPIEKPALIAVAIFALMAIGCAALGGFVPAGPHRNLLAAGSGFWLLMLFVPWAFTLSKGWSDAMHSAVAAAFGALAGACLSLCFASGNGFGPLLGHSISGAFTGFVCYWLAAIRSQMLRLARGGVGDP